MNNIDTTLSEGSMNLYYANHKNSVPTYTNSTYLLKVNSLIQISKSFGKEGQFLKAIGTTEKMISYYRRI